MKKNQVYKLIIPIVLLLGAATAFIVAVLGSTQGNTSVAEPQATTAYVAFLKIDGVDGEAMAQDHENWIEVLAYSHNVMVGTSSGTARTAATAEHAPLRVTRAVDRSSPKLYEYCVKGQVISTVELECCRFFGEQLEVFYRIELQNARITSVQDYGVIAGEIPTETVSFNYEAIKYTYTEFGADGSKKGTVESGWINVETLEA